MPGMARSIRKVSLGCELNGNSPLNFSLPLKLFSDVFNHRSNDSTGVTGFDKRGLKSPLLPAGFAFCDTVIRYEFFQAICLVYSHNIAFRLDAMTFRHTYYSCSFSYAKRGFVGSGVGVGWGKLG